MATRPRTPCEGSEKTQPRTLIGQIKKRMLTSHPARHIRPFSRNHSQQISSNREERCYTSKKRKLELIETEILTSNISKNASNGILETWNSIPDTFNCLKKLVHAVLSIIFIYLCLRVIIFRDE
ncbi:hypothetical protein TNCV_955301 [Trichonephila clavipes]|nr:hypothetical protein TNCV_955301 [Trichonephila clavipes]